MFRTLAAATLIAIALPLAAAAGTIEPFADQQIAANLEAELLPMVPAVEPPKVKTAAICHKVVASSPKKRDRRAAPEFRCAS